MQLGPHELVDLFVSFKAASPSTLQSNAPLASITKSVCVSQDGQNNDAVTIKDCNGKKVPHHYLGDGFCDDGTNTKAGGVNLDCTVFMCDDGDCANDAKCKKIPGRNKQGYMGRHQLEIKANAASPTYGVVKDQMGVDFFTDFTANVKYWVYTTIDEKHKGHIQDTILTVFGADGKTQLIQNDDGPYGKDNSFLHLTPAAAIKSGVIRVTPKTLKDRGSFQLRVSTAKPCCTAKPCKVLVGKVEDACGTCGGNNWNPNNCAGKGR